MIIAVIAIALIILWLTGFFGPPVIPEIVLPILHISWTDPVVRAIVILVVVVLVVILLRK